MRRCDEEDGLEVDADSSHSIRLGARVNGADIVGEDVAECDCD